MASDEKFELKHILYSLTLNTLEFIFFFTWYWWWKMEWLISKHYMGESGYKIYMKEKKERADLDIKNFSFGETTAMTTKLILSEIEPKKGQIIYDLGSGRGVFLFTAYFMYGLRGIGVEIFKTYVEKCKKIRHALKAAGIMFHQGNIAEADLSDADIVYMAGTTFQADVVEKVKENLTKTEPGTIVILTRHTLPDNNFVLFNEGDFPFSWGTDHVRFYRKK